MSEDLKLPAELAACEARLAAQPLPAPSLVRDELMYRAGWAAAEAKLAGRPVEMPTRAPAGGWSRGRAWRMSLASAAVAASLTAVAAWWALPREASLLAQPVAAPATAPIAVEEPRLAVAAPAPRGSFHRPSAGGVDLTTLLLRQEPRG
ncbi:MAG TPA: hypothetical protein PKC18_17570, partial [Lacipirellulaceae bacterium]|nr:hypothetical protein [Lacipirellulaceae bacterium]